MLNFGVFLGICLLIGLSTLEFANADENAKVVLKVVSANEIGNVFAKYPNATLVRRFLKEDKSSVTESKTIVTYTLGNRLNGDSLVAYDVQHNSWVYPQDVQLNINYPSSGTGSIVTYVEIVVSQSNELGSAYVVYGGIGQRLISIVVEARSTYKFNYNVSIYGI